MGQMKYYSSLYLDLEKDIVIDFYKDKNNYYYVLRTPNHKTGNLISNLAKVCKLPISTDDNGLKIIKGNVPSYINEENKRIHILKFVGKTIAVINSKGVIMRRATVPAIAKTFMSQSKDLSLPLNNVFVRTYIEEEYKFQTDLHTHMNANLYPDVLIALGIYHQIRYPYYYIKKLGLKLSAKQYNFLEKQRNKVSLKFSDSSLKGKYRERRIDDNTFINFADLILNNIKDSTFNINKIRVSLAILKDGQAVFTNLEKLYMYRYVFAKGKESDKKIVLKNFDKLFDLDIRNYLNSMLADGENNDYRNNSLLQDKLLWIARMYRDSGIKYVEISNTTLVKNSDEPIDFLKEVHYILPLIEKETGVRIRFLAALRRIPLTLVKDEITSDNYLSENLAVLKAVCKDPYVVGSDFVGEEINDITELKPIIKELVEYAKDDPDFTIRIHAGENDSLKDNVSNALKCVKDSLSVNQRMPHLRIGHGIYTANLKTKKGKQLIKDLKDNDVVLEFQLTSNVRLNNLVVLSNHPIKEYLRNGVKAVQGSDGPGIYGTNSLDEELALISMLKLNKSDLSKICDTEREILKESEKAFKRKSIAFDKLCNGRSLEDALKEEIKKNVSDIKNIKLTIKDKYDSFKVLNNQVHDFPLDKLPIVVAGGSFSSNEKISKMNSFEKKMIDNLLRKLSPSKVFFVIGHKLNAYEKYLWENRGNHEVYAIVPRDISSFEMKRLIKANIPLRISPELLGNGIYKSFNYEIFERRPSCLIGIDGNLSLGNLIQEAKNGKAKALIYVSNNSFALKQKANTLQGYVKIYMNDKDVLMMIREIKKKIREL